MQYAMELCGISKVIFNIVLKIGDYTLNLLSLISTNTHL